MPTTPGTDIARMFKALLRLLGIPRSHIRKAAEVEDLLSVELKSIDLSPYQRELVERKIAEFIADSSAIYARYREAVARANALPLMFDWLAFMALRPDGHVVLVPCDDEPGPIEVVLEERVRNIGLFRGTELHPELQFLAPPKPADAIECPHCRGAGKLAFPHGHERQFENVICFCGGTGWLPRSASSS